MSAEIMVRGATAPLVFTEEQQRMIRDSFASGASPEAFAMLMEVAKARGLNPLLKQVHFVERWDKAKGRMVWSTQVSTDGMRAIEVKHTDTLRGADFHGLRSFREEYPVAACTILYLGRKASIVDDVEIRPVGDFLQQLPTWI